MVDPSAWHWHVAHPHGYGDQPKLGRSLGPVKKTIL
jgi:hypothetical protein